MATHELDYLLSLRQVALITDTPIRTLQDWTAGANPPMPHEHVGPGRRVKVRVSVVRRMFPRGCLRLERLRPVVSDVAFETIQNVLERTGT